MFIDRLSDQPSFHKKRNPLDYEDLENKPAIDGKPLHSDTTSEKLGLATKEELNAYVKLNSETTQIIDSDIALANGKKLLGVKKDTAQANLLSVGDYGTYEQ
ncbi:MAG: hypothetical protein LBK62_06065, partial [Treponema sp.]|nr:hypothetical protein [Treponema sp.]